MSDLWDSPGIIETHSGGGFDLFSPDPDTIRLPDIAASPAHTCRFGGHCRHFYSVAHHSLHVADELADNSPRLQLIGLLHDAGEAYLGDIPRPIKTELNELDQILTAVWTAFGIEPPTEAEWDEVMDADDKLLAYEATHLLEGGDWVERSPDLEYDLHSEPMDQTRAQYQSKAESLLEQVS